jgi:hypothetical protein
MEICYIRVSSRQLFGGASQLDKPEEAINLMLMIIEETSRETD